LTETQTQATNREIQTAARELINDLAAAIGPEASHEFGPYAGLWTEMRRMAALPLHIRIDEPDRFAAQLSAAGQSGTTAVMARWAMITLLIDRQHTGMSIRHSWYQHIIDLAREIADRAMPPTAM